MSRILLDSSIIIDLLRRKDKTQTLLHKLTLQGYHLAIAIITHAELYSGKSIWEKQKAREELETILQYIEIISIDKSISEKAGEIRAHYQINLLDAIIASTAIHHNLSLATLNIKDFEKIPKLKLYT